MAECSVDGCLKLIFGFILMFPVTEILPIHGPREMLDLFRHMLEVHQQQHHSKFYVGYRQNHHGELLSLISLISLVGISVLPHMSRSLRRLGLCCSSPSPRLLCGTLNDSTVCSAFPKVHAKLSHPRPKSHVSIFPYVPQDEGHIPKIPSSNQPWCAGKWTIEIGDFPHTLR